MHNTPHNSPEDKIPGDDIMDSDEFLNTDIGQEWCEFLSTTDSSMMTTATTVSRPSVCVSNCIISSTKNSTSIMSFTTTSSHVVTSTTHCHSITDSSRENCVQKIPDHVTTSSVSQFTG